MQVTSPLGSRPLRLLNPTATTGLSSEEALGAVLQPVIDSTHTDNVSGASDTAGAAVSAPGTADTTAADSRCSNHPVGLHSHVVQHNNSIN